MLLGAAVVVGALFAPWYVVDIGPAARDALGSQAGRLPDGLAAFARELVTLLPSRIEANAWTAFERTDVVLLACALGAGFAALLGRLDIAAAAGAAALATAVWVMIDRPGPRELVGLGWGGWLALGGALLIVVAAKLPDRPRAGTRVDYAPPSDGVIRVQVMGDPSRSVPPPTG